MASVVRALREKLGDEAMGGLQSFVDDAGRRWKDEVLTVALGEFRLDMAKEFAAVRVEAAKEFAAVRGEMAKEFAAVRGEMAKEFAAVRGEMAETRFSMLKWAFVFWVGQLVAMTGIMTLLLRVIGR